MNVKHLDHLNMTVGDLNASVAWYKRVFGFETVETGRYKGRRWAIIKAGEALLCMYEWPERTDPKVTTAHSVSHFALRLNDRDAWIEHLDTLAEPTFYESPVEWPSSRSWYVKDPSGHEIEVVTWNADIVRFAA